MSEAIALRPQVMVTEPPPYNLPSRSIEYMALLDCFSNKRIDIEVLAKVSYTGTQRDLASKS